MTVADDERRRLERDLHDGAQSHLMGIAVKVQLARALVAADPAAAADVLTEIEHDLTTANAQLRSLAHGIFPPRCSPAACATPCRGSPPTPRSTSSR